VRINLTKTAFTSAEIEFIVARLEQALEKGFVVRRVEKNPYLLASFRGVEEAGISPKWNVKVYRYSPKRRGHSIVCVDQYVLDRLLAEDYGSFTPPALQLLRIDDAGWGFPLCGVMVGVSDETEVRVAVVPVEYFRADTPNHFGTKRYLRRYGDLALRLLDEFGAAPETHRIEICSGYVNQPLRGRLRGRGYDVRVVEIKGLLQVELEERYRRYVEEEIGADVYYDPKDMSKSEIPRRYRAALAYGRIHYPEQIKTGWGAIGRDPDTG